MGEGTDVGSAIAGGVGLVLGAVAAGTAIKAVANIADEVAKPGNKKKGFEGVKAMKLPKVKTPKVPKQTKIKPLEIKPKGAGKGIIPFTMGSAKKVAQTVPMYGTPFKPKVQPDIKKFVPKTVLPKGFKFTNPLKG